jgi:flagellar basal body-associated protein FliL
MKKNALSLSLMLVLVLSACGAATVAPMVSYSDAALNVRDLEKAGAAQEMPESAAQDSASLAPFTNPSDRIVLMNASLTLVVNDPADIASKITDLAFAKGGWVESSSITQSVYGSSGEKYYAGQISIRVPVDSAQQLKAALTEIEALAVEVKNREMTGQDVTAEYTDAQSRLRNLRASEQRLLEIMKAAADTEDVLAVELQLSRVLSEIEVLEGQIKYYDTAANYSLINITLEPFIPSQPINIGGWHPEGVAKEALEDLIHGLQGLADFLIRLGICGIPALIVIALFVAPFVLVTRFIIRRNRKSQAQSQAPKPTQ